MGNKKKHRRFVRALLVLLAIYVIWLGWLWLRHRQPALKAPPQDPLEAVGVYHIHTRFSDGAREPEEIARIAARQGLDFIILTDHGNPNPSFLAQRRRQAGLLVLAGSELSVNRGHLVALAFQQPRAPFSQVAEEAAQQVKAHGGFTVIAHPYSKVRWSWGEHAGYSGIEILSADAMLRRNWPSLLLTLPLLPLAARIPMLRIFSYPERNLMRWDALCRTHPLYAYYSCDAHLLYSSLLSLFTLHVLLPRPLPEDYDEAAGLISESLREGRFYNCINSAAPGHGFRFWGEDDTSGRIPMGRTVRWESGIRLFIRLPEAVQAEWRLLQNGQPVYSTQERQGSFSPTSPGTYRVEAYLKQRTPLKRTCPWIVSNPIFLRE
jgi:hypothetical protein